MVHSTVIVLLFTAYKLQVTWNKKSLNTSYERSSQMLTFQIS